MVKHFIAAGILLACVCADVHAARQLSSVSLATSGRPLEVAIALAQAGIPIGLELHAADRDPGPKRDRTDPLHPSVSIPALVEAFNRSHTSYRAASMDGVLVIRPANGHHSYLESPLTLKDPVVTGAMAALRVIFGPIDVQLNAPGGIVGSRFVTPEESGDHVTITLPPGTTVISALNTLVKQSGQGWLVITTPSRHGAKLDVTEIGLIHPNGALSLTSLSHH